MRAILIPLLLLLALPSAADVLLLKDGRRFEGTVKKETKTEIVFATEFGEMTFKLKEVSRIEKGQTPRQEFDARLAKAKTAAELYELGKWAEGKRLRTQAKRAMRKVREVDPSHEGANLWLGYVKYKGQWVTEEERGELEARAAADEMRKRGLVKHGERWVTLAEKEKLDAGLVYHEGKWMTAEEQKAAQGLVLVEGSWIPFYVAKAMEHGALVLEGAGVSGEVVLGPDHAVVGPFDREFLESISSGLVRGRALFDAHFEALPGVDLLGGRAAELYVWGRDDSQYTETVDYLASLTDTVPEGWADAVRRTHGFLYWDPFCCSSARVKGRPQDHLAGHSYHHWAHLLLNRHRYEGRLLPPWFDEGFATAFEFQIHGRIDVMCLGKPASIVTESGGRTTAKKRTVEYVFDQDLVREGRWKDTLLLALRDGETKVPSLDDLARTQFGELTVLDIVVGHAICRWLQSKEGALERFHASLRSSAPDAPQRVFFENPVRHKRYDAAFQAAVGMGWREADSAWREWFLTGALEEEAETEEKKDSGSRRRRRRDR